MVYTKKSYKRKPYVKKQASWRKYAGKALMSGGHSGLKVLKKALGLNTESKYLDTTQSTTFSSTLTLLNSMLTIPIGNTSNTRNGASCRLTHWRFNAVITADPTCTFTQIVRLIAFVEPKGLAGTALTAAQVVQSASDFKTFYNMDTEGYKIILDKNYSVGPIGSDFSSKAIDFSYSPLEHELKWTDADTTGVIGDMTGGIIRMGIMSVSNTTPPTFAIYHRVNFVDN